MPIKVNLKKYLHYQAYFLSSKTQSPDLNIVLPLCKNKLLLFQEIPALLIFFVALATSTKNSPYSPDFKTLSQETHFK